MKGVRLWPSDTNQGSNTVRPIVSDKAMLKLTAGL